MTFTFGFNEQNSNANTTQPFSNNTTNETFQIPTQEPNLQNQTMATPPPAVGTAPTMGFGGFGNGMNFNNNNNLQNMPELGAQPFQTAPTEQKEVTYDTLLQDLAKPEKDAVMNIKGLISSSDEYVTKIQKIIEKQQLSNDQIQLQLQNIERLILQHQIYVRADAIRINRLTSRHQEQRSYTLQNQFKEYVDQEINGEIDRAIGQIDMHNPNMNSIVCYENVLKVIEEQIKAIQQIEVGL